MLTLQESLLQPFLSSKGTFTLVLIIDLKNQILPCTFHARWAIKEVCWHRLISYIDDTMYNMTYSLFCMITFTQVISIWCPKKDKVHFWPFTLINHHQMPKVRGVLKSVDWINGQKLTWYFFSGHGVFADCFFKVFGTPNEDQIFVCCICLE